MSDEKQLPTHIGGYQHIGYGNYQEGDIWVCDGKPWSFIDDEWIGKSILHGTFAGYSAYRKMDCPKQGGHGLKIDGRNGKCPPEPETFRKEDWYYIPDNKDGAYIPQDDAARKQSPMFRGLLGYFPAALFEVAAHSQESDQKHNPGATDGPTWARSKSSDHADCIVRHLVDAGKRGTLNRKYHLRALAWRALALLQEECEAEGSTPGVSSR